jgi:ketosteroid isomerase-like protein
MSAVEIVKEGIAALDAGDMTKLADMLAEDMVFAGPTPQPVGKREYVGLQSALKAAMPDWMLNATDLKEDGDQVTAELAITGTHTAELKLPMPGMPAVPATGKKVTLPKQKATFTVKDGKISRREVEVQPGGGVSGVLAQLGVEMPK